MAENYSCFIAVSFFSILATISNIYMVKHIFSSNIQSFGAGFTFKFIGIANAVCAISISIHKLEDVKELLPVFVTASIAVVLSHNCQLGFNISLAYERLRIIKHANKYHTKESKKRLEKKLMLCVTSLSVLLAVLSSTLRFIWDKAMYLLIPLAVSRILGYIILCILYIKVYYAMKSQDLTIAPDSARQGEPSTSSNEMNIKRRERLQHSKMFFIGITTSFLICNLPNMIVLFFVDNLPLCNTLKGALVTASICLSSCGMVFDALWYFYMDRRSKRMQIKRRAVATV